jgi:transposase
MKVNCYIKQRKPLLTEENKENRYKFAKKYKSYSFFDWKTIIWSDESKFSLINTNKKEYYWKEKSSPLEESNIKKTKKFGGGGIMAWGCITPYGVGELVRLDGKIDSKKYIDVLSNGLMKTLEKYELNPKRVKFMQDNAPIHKAKGTIEWLKINKIKVLDWPAQSPDLNPIENLWGIIDKKVRKSKQNICNVDDLWEVVRNEWNSIDEETLRSLYLSMTSRISDLYDSKGGYTRY